MARSFEVIYSYAPKAAVSRLETFRARFPYRNMEHHGQIYRVWDVCDARNSSFAAVYLPSGLGTGEIWFPYMLYNRMDVRSIALSLAADEDPLVLVRAWGELLKEMGVQKCVLIGQSIGGLLAQIMAKEFPEMVLGLCLPTCGCPSETLSQEVRDTWQLRRKLKRRMSWRSFTTRDRLKMASEMFNAMCPEDYQESQAFWSAFIEETFDEYVYKDQYVAVNTQMVPNIYSNIFLKPSDFSDELKVLILPSQGDRTFGEKERGELIKMFPQAQVSDIGRFGAFAMQIDEDRLTEIICGFINSTIPTV